MTRQPNTAPPSAEKASRLPVIIALATMAVWGGTPLFTKLAVNEIDALLVGVLRTVIAGVIAVPALIAMRQALPADRRSRWVLAYSGFAAFVAFPLIFSVGQKTTSATHAALILATLPVFTSLFGKLVERTPASRMWLGGLALAFGGEIALIVWRAPGAAGGTLRGDALVLLSSVICSTGYVAGARLAQTGYRSLATTLWGVAGASVALLPLTVWSLATAGVPEASSVAWGSILVLAALTSIVGYVAWYWALAHGGISRIASIQFTQPLFGLALAAVVLAERPAPLTVVAGAAILAGAAIVQRAANRTTGAGATG